MIVYEMKGRKQNTALVVKCRELKDQGKSFEEIGAAMGISPAMARYYCKQTPRSSQYKSLASCFFKAPREIQIKVAEMIGYILPEEIKQTAEEINETYNTIKESENER